MKIEFFLQKIKDNFPKLKWRKHRVLMHGWDHIVIILDEKIVFRFPKDKLAREKFQDEIRLFRYLKKKVKANIPDYMYISKDKSFAGYDKLNGQELTYSNFRKLSSQEKESLAEQLADFISTLHVTPKSIITKYNIKTQDERKLYKKLLRDAEKIIFPRVSKKDIQLIEEYFGELKDALSQKYSNVLVHYDLTGEHILRDSKKKKLNIIDFFDCAFGDPAIDFAGLLEYGINFTEKVFNPYSGKKDDNMLKRSQLYFKRIPL